MSASKGSKGPTDALMGLSVSEARLLLLGIVCEDGGKIDFPLLSQKAGITLSSARTMYPKAKKKLLQLQLTNKANDDVDTTPSKKAPAKKRRRPAKKRKVSEEHETPDEADIAGSAEDTHAGPEETDETETAEPVAIKDETPIESIKEEV